MADLPFQVTYRVPRLRNLELIEVSGISVRYNYNYPYVNPSLTDETVTQELKMGHQYSNLKPV